MQLTNYSRVAIVGGGPSGALTAYYMLRTAKEVGLKLIVEIYEPGDFCATGPKGCNFCGGIVSETLVQMLATDGINLPPRVVQRGIDAYQLHTEQGSTSVSTPMEEMRIAALFRGSGPRQRSGDAGIEYNSFDGFLLDLAIDTGARHLPYRVSQITFDKGRPVVTAKGSEPRTYDLVVGAVGVNGGGLKAFEKAGIKLKTPKTTKAFVTEIYMGKETIEAHFGNSMHVFLIRLPGILFSAIIPKSEFVTVIMLGTDLDKERAMRFLEHPTVKRCFPEGMDLSPDACRCLPLISLGMSSPLYTDRMVLVGDACVSRLYKDGLGAAYRTAKACAITSVIYGISKEDFKRHYRPVCWRLHKDNLIGKVIFLTVGLFKAVPFLTAGMVAMVQQEQAWEPKKRAMTLVLWDTFSGSNTYLSIFKRCMGIPFLFRLVIQGIRSYLPFGAERSKR